MNIELEVLKTVTERLNDSNTPYMISGSVAASYYSKPRMTRDIDIVVELAGSEVDKFTALFQKDFYADKEYIEKEVLRKGMFNLIHSQYAVKVDFIIRKDSEFQKTAFSRRKELLVENKPAWFISPEDLILAKLDWAKDSHSEMQLKDVRNLIKAVASLDIDYIKKWVSKLGLEKLYKEAINE